MRLVMTSRLATVVGDGVRREMAVVRAVLVWVVDLVVTDFVDAVLEEGLGLRPFFVLVLKGLAMGARLMAVVVASEVAPTEMARTSSAVVRRRDNIYCTPAGLVEVWEMTGTGSFGWGPG